MRTSESQFTLEQYVQLMTCFLEKENGPLVCSSDEWIFEKCDYIYMKKSGTVKDNSY